MDKLANCKICGQPCKKHKEWWPLCLLVGIPAHLDSFCSEECKQKWHGEGCIRFGRRWRNQMIGFLILCSIIAVICMAL